VVNESRIWRRSIILFELYETVEDGRFHYRGWMHGMEGSRNQNQSRLNKGNVTYSVIPHKKICIGNAEQAIGIHVDHYVGMQIRSEYFCVCLELLSSL